MNDRPQSTTGREYKVGEHQNLLSRTDTQGRITYAAQSFVEVSGYSREELLGAPHSIVRHPDMPKEAFANLWQTLARGEIWVGLVKNRRKNGDYYWVRAHVTPIVENGQVQGYTSVRVKPSEEEIRLAEDTYARLRAGDRRGIRLDNGRIVQTGLAARLQRLHLNSLRARILAALSINAVFLLLALGLVLWRHNALQGELNALDGSNAAAARLLDGVLQAQTGFDYLQVGVLLLTALLGAGAFAWMLRTVRGEIRRATQFAMQIAAGNLAAARDAGSRNEFATLTAMLEVMQRSLGNIATEVNASLGLVRPAAAQVAAGNDDLASRTEQQAASLQQTAASMEQITATVQQNADNARQASQLANSAAVEVRNSGAAMHQVVERMDSITASSQKIAEIVRVIDAIAFQTNILALNASVEAARAGEHGRGFAVVASEVRSLANRSAGAAAEVRQLIERSNQEVGLGAAQVRQAEQAIEAVIEAVIKVNDIMGEIASASDEQNRGIEQVNCAVAQMDEVTQRNAGLVGESARSARTLETQVGELANSIAVLRLAGQGTEGAPAQDTPRPAHKVHHVQPDSRPAPRVHRRHGAAQRTPPLRAPAVAEEWRSF